ncbi:MAG: LTA synthase family protein, partial [Solirubrobacterales bacterium]
VGIVIDKVGGQVDMMPTLAYLLGIDIKKYDTTVMGRNLFGSSSGMAILSTGDILGKPDDVEHLDEVQTVADNIIKGNYYQQNEKSLTSSK